MIKKNNHKNGTNFWWEQPSRKEENGRRWRFRKFKSVKELLESLRN